MEEKKISWWKENSAFIVPALVLIMLLIYALLYSPKGVVVLTTPTAAKFAEALVAQAERLGGGKKFHLEVTDVGTLEVMNKKKAVALIAPFSQELFSLRALPVGVDALVVVSRDGRGLNQEEIPHLEKSGKFFYPSRDLWFFFSYRIGPVSKNPQIFTPGESIPPDAVALVPWSQIQRTNLKVGPYNGMFPTENSISALQYPLWYPFFLFVSSEKSAKEAGADLLIKASKQESFRKTLQKLGFYPWPEK